MREIIEIFGELEWETTETLPMLEDERSRDGGGPGSFNKCLKKICDSSTYQYYTKDKLSLR